MGWRAVVSENGNVTGYRETNTGERISVQEFERRHMMMGQDSGSQLTTGARTGGNTGSYPLTVTGVQSPGGLTIDQPRHLGASQLIQEGAVTAPVDTQQMPAYPQQMPIENQPMPQDPQYSGSQPVPLEQPMPNAGAPVGSTLREASEPNNDSMAAHRGYVRHPKGFLDMTSIALVLPSLGMLIVFVIIVITRVKSIRKKRQAEKEFAEKQGRQV